MLRERGLKKWTAMMLPEHVVLLEEWRAQDIVEKRPILDEECLQNYAERIRQVWLNQESVTILCWEQERKMAHTGIIIACNMYTRRIQMDEGAGQISIDVSTILDVLEME